MNRLQMSSRQAYVLSLGCSNTKGASDLGLIGSKARQLEGLSKERGIDKVIGSFHPNEMTLVSHEEKIVL